MSGKGSVNAGEAGTIDVGGDLTVNRLGFGAMRITGNGIWGPPADREVAIAVLKRAYELGVNFIDTADAYGPEVSEELIAAALHPYADDLVIATKGGLTRSGPNKWEADGRPEYLRKALEGSLKRLKTDRITLYQFHRPDPKVPMEDSIGEIVKMKDEGKIRHIGVCNVTETELHRAQRLTPIVSVQNRYNVADRTSESMVDQCEQETMAFLPWAPILDIDEGGTIAEMAKKHKATPRQIVLAWLLARSPNILPIPGTGTVAHLEENVAAAGISLEPHEIEALTAGKL